MTQAGHQATIVSTDKGYCQLLSPTLRIRDYFQKRWLDAPFIDKEYLALTAAVADYWGLAGIQQFKGTGCCGNRTKKRHAAAGRVSESGRNI